MEARLVLKLIREETGASYLEIFPSQFSAQ